MMVSVIRSGVCLYVFMSVCVCVCVCVCVVCVCVYMRLCVYVCENFQLFCLNDVIKLANMDGSKLK